MILNILNCLTKNFEPCELIHIYKLVRCNIERKQHCWRKQPIFLPCFRIVAYSRYFPLIICSGLHSLVERTEDFQPIYPLLQYEFASRWLHIFFFFKSKFLLFVIIITVQCKFKTNVSTQVLLFSPLWCPSLQHFDYIYWTCCNWTCFKKIFHRFQAHYIMNGPHI